MFQQRSAELSGRTGARQILSDTNANNSIHMIFRELSCSNKLPGGIGPFSAELRRFDVTKVPRRVLLPSTEISRVSATIKAANLPFS